MINIFIDTSAFYASYDKDDINYSLACGFFDEIKKNKIYKLTFSNLIFNETMTLIRSRIGIEQSIRFGESLRNSRRFQNIFISPDLEDKAWNIFSKYSDKSFSFTDCASFALMKEHNITKAFTFDPHFEQFGLEAVPG